MRDVPSGIYRFDATAGLRRSGQAFARQAVIYPGIDRLSPGDRHNSSELALFCPFSAPQTINQWPQQASMLAPTLAKSKQPTLSYVQKKGRFCTLKLVPFSPLCRLLSLFTGGARLRSTDKYSYLHLYVRGRIFPRFVSR